MLDPVIVLASGQTYDRGSILHWFRMGKKTDPLTGGWGTGVCPGVCPGSVRCMADWL